MVAEYSVLLFAIGIEYKVRKLEVSQKTFIKPATNGNDKRVTNVSVVVSTAEEVMIFLKEFFKGHFFPKENIENLKKWNLILPPPSLFFYGIGLEILFIPRIVSPFKPIGEI